MRRTDTLEVVLLVIASLAALLGVAYFFLPSVPGPRGASPRATCVNIMRQLALALHNYHDDYGMFPPAYTVDSEGRRLHSWRTLLLPYLDRHDIYDSIRLDEPWDSPHNRVNGRQFASIGMLIMSCPSDVEVNNVTSQMTSYLAVVGPDTAFPGSESISLDQIVDGPGQTLLIVEVANSGIRWMEPRDLDVTTMAETVNAASGQGIRSEHAGGAVVAYADGTVDFLSDTTTAKELAAMLTIAGGERIPGRD